MSKNHLIESKPQTDTASASLAPVSYIRHKNIIELLDSLDRRSQLAGLRSLAGAVQFTMINTADWIIRREDNAIASSDPTLDERNAADEFTRGQEHVDFEANQFGTEALQTPEEKLKQYSHLYYGLVDKIRTLHPAPFERPRGLMQTLTDFVPRGASLSVDTLKLLEAAESEPGEFAAAREQFKERKSAEMTTRKPRIVELLNQNADCMPLLDTFDELPPHVQLRLTTAAWKGVYYSRKSLVTYIGTYNKLDDLAAVTMMAKDLELIADFCEKYENDNATLFEVMIEAGVQVYGIEDARKDVKKPRQ